MKTLKIHRKVLSPRGSNARAQRVLANERGNAVALVLLVLGVVTMLGLGLMTQSRIDTKFVSSYKSHDSVFNLADGAAQLAYKRLAFTPAPKYKGLSISKTFYNDAQYVKTGGTGPDVRERGTFWPVMVFHGPDTRPNASGLAGYEIGKGFVVECWTAQGIGKRLDSSKVVDTTTKVKYQPAETSIQMAVQKIVKQ